MTKKMSSTGTGKVTLKSWHSQGSLSFAALVFFVARITFCSLAVRSEEPAMQPSRSHSFTLYYTRIHDLAQPFSTTPRAPLMKTLDENWISTKRYATDLFVSFFCLRAHMFAPRRFWRYTPCLSVNGRRMTSCATRLHAKQKTDSLLNRKLR